MKYKSYIILSETFTFPGYRGYNVFRWKQYLHPAIREYIFFLIIESMKLHFHSTCSRSVITEKMKIKWPIKESNLSLNGSFILLKLVIPEVKIRELKTFI